MTTPTKLLIVIGDTATDRNYGVKRAEAKNMKYDSVIQLEGKALPHLSPVSNRLKELKLLNSNTSLKSHLQTYNTTNKLN